MNDKSTYRVYIRKNILLTRVFKKLYSDLIFGWEIVSMGNFIFYCMWMSQIERTLIVLKPDTLARGLCGEILTRFEKVGLKIVAMKMLKPNKDFFYHHYETIGSMISRRGEKPFNDNLIYMQKSPVIAIVLE